MIISTMKPIDVYVLSEDDSRFKPISVNQNQLDEKLSTFDILLFLDPNTNKAWVRKGRQTSIRIRLGANVQAQNILDEKKIQMDIILIEEADEPLEFCLLMGWEVE